MDKRYIAINDYAVALNMTRQNVYKWILYGTVKYIRDSRGRIFVDLENSRRTRHFKGKEYTI